MGWSLWGIGLNDRLGHFYIPCERALDPNLIPGRVTLIFRACDLSQSQHWDSPRRTQEIFPGLRRGVPVGLAGRCGGATTQPLKATRPKMGRCAGARKSRPEITTFRRWYVCRKRTSDKENTASVQRSSPCTRDVISRLPGRLVDVHAERGKDGLLMPRTWALKYK